ncbi:hypothetical protein MJH12_18745 [bacterium]|nr:hypothetical protein [bacterium]
MQKHNNIEGLFYGNYQAGALIARQSLIIDSDQQSIIISPGTNFASQEVQNLVKLYPIKAIIAPNSYHNMGVSLVQKQFDVPCYAAECGLARLSKFPIKKLTNINQLKFLREDVQVFVPDGQKMGESWIALGQDTYRTLIVTDAFFNLKEVNKQFLMKILTKLADNAPGFKVSRLFVLIGVQDKKVYSKSVRDYFKKNLFQEMIVAHGEIQVDQIAQLVDQSMLERAL